MGSDRGWAPLGELCEAIVDCEHKTAPTAELGIRSIRTTNIKNGRLDLENANRVTPETYKLWTARIEPRPGDLILAREAPVGEVGIVPKRTKVCLGQRTVLIRTDETKLHSRYLLYLLITPWMRHELLSRAEGSTVPHLNMSDIRSLDIPEIPPLPEQKAIAHILGTLDDKIELNRRMNETLEAMARAIFKSWFVDFLPVREKQRARTQTGDPVKAKMEGRQPAGMDVEAAALFPDELVPSELGMIPKGWRVDNLGKHIEISRESVKPFEHPDEEFDHYSIPGYDDGRRPVTEKGSQIRSSKYIVPETSVLLSKLNPRFPRQWLPNLRERRRSICSTEFLVVQSKTWLSREYLYSFFASSHFQDTYRTMATGTSGSHQRVKPEYLLAEASPIPSVDVIAAFTRVTRPLFAKGARQRRESRTLAELRDTLLPKLISGEMRVPDAEQIAESVL